MAKQFEFEATHVYNADPKRVFPLLCPVYETDYIDGWEFEMIYTNSGFVELGCVFTTPYKGDEKTVWTVSLHNPKNFIIEFIRVTPNLESVTISIVLNWLGSTQTEALIRYVHTPLTKEQEEYLTSEYEAVFNEDITYWEAALNHYLGTGKLLKK